MGHCLETVSGKLFDPINPDPSQIDIRDIAWHLSRIPRFCGATIPRIPYSVAQHSVQVMKDIEVLTDGNPRMMFHGLMHDAAEAFISDIPSPIKRIPEIHDKIVELEDKILRCIYTACGVTMPDEKEVEIVHKADMDQRSIEAYNFMYSRGKDWGLPSVTFEKLQEFEAPMTNVKAYDTFMEWYNIIIVGAKDVC